MSTLARAADSPDHRGSPRVGNSELDRETLLRCRALDRVAFRAFVVHYERLVFACLSRMLGRGPHVDDLAQEVFLRAYRAFPSFDVNAEARVSSWLLTIATRAALDVVKRRVVPVRPLEAAGEVSAGTTPEASLSRAELADAIERAAAALPEEQRVALVLAEHHGWSIADIAAAMDVPEATVKTRLFRAREKMRGSLRDEWRDP
jgi:RNA polymerase sigma-70 factor (ECF subfamily)